MTLGTCFTEAGGKTPRLWRGLQKAAGQGHYEHPGIADGNETVPEEVHKAMPVNKQVLIQDQTQTERLFPGDEKIGQV